MGSLAFDRWSASAEGQAALAGYGAWADETYPPPTSEELELMAVALEEAATATMGPELECPF